MKVYLLFERRFAHVAAGPTEQIVYIATSRSVPGDARSAQRARAGVIAVLRDMARRVS